MANDINTPAGFIAEFDEQVRNLSARGRWCGGGIAIAYEKAGLLRNSPRGYTDMDPVIDIADELLSDAGKALKAKATGDIMNRLRDSARAAAKYGLSGGYATADLLTPALNALGIAGRYVTRREYYNNFTVTMTTTESMAGSETTINAAMQAAVKAAAEAAGLTVHSADSLLDARARAITVPVWQDADDATA